MTLAIQKDIQERARKQVIKILGDDPEDVLPNAEDIRKMPYIDMVVKEVSSHVFHYYIFLISFLFGV
jgi:hypothetical protein